MKLATRFSRHSVQVTDRGSFLSTDVLRQRVPSVFATDKHDSRSDGYTYIPTVDILEQLQAADWRPTFAVQAVPRKEGRYEHARHMLRLRHASSEFSAGEVPELILVNSHDGTSSYQLLGGFFRFVCCNGLILGDGSLEVRVPHRGNIIEGVVGGAASMLEHFGSAARSVDRMKSIGLSVGESRAFAEAAIGLRWDDPSRVDPDRVLRVQRDADTDSSLWTLLNRVQENVIGGGVAVRDPAKPRTTRSARPVAGITENIRLNRALWTLAEKMAELKAA